MRQTTNYKLQKPDYNNVADIEVINGNFDKIDTELVKKANLSDLEDKVDKQPGKSLSSNDFTDKDKQKLSNLPNQAELNLTLEAKIPKADIVNNLTSGGSTKVLSAEQGKIIGSQLMDFELVSMQAGISKKTTFQSNGSILEVLKKTSGNVKVADRETVFLSDGRIREVVKFYNPAGTTAIKTITKTTTFRPDGSIVEE